MRESYSHTSFGRTLINESEKEKDETEEMLRECVVKIVE